MKHKRIEITIEANRCFYISSPRIVSSWCVGCAAQVEMVTVDEAAILLNATSRAVFRWAEASQVHSIETANGRLLICLNSLASPSQIQILKESKK